jgi:hypothetical protein
MADIFGACMIESLMRYTGVAKIELIKNVSQTVRSLYLHF